MRVPLLRQRFFFEPTQCVTGIRYLRVAENAANQQIRDSSSAFSVYSRAQSIRRFPMQLMELINAAGGISSIASQLGLDEKQAQAGAAALLPTLVQGMRAHVTGPTGGSGLDGLTSLLQGAGGTSLLENVLGPSATNIGAGNDLLGQLLGSKDASRAAAEQAAQSSGVSADTLKKMLPLLAMVVTGVMAAKQNGVQSGGGGLLGQLGGMLANSKSPGGLGALLDLDGDGNPLDDIAGLAGKFFGR
jgi:hypothetical protein